MNVIFKSNLELNGSWLEGSTLSERWMRFHNLIFKNGKGIFSFSSLGLTYLTNLHNFIFENINPLGYDLFSLPSIRDKDAKKYRDLPDNFFTKEMVFSSTSEENFFDLTFSSSKDVKIIQFSKNFRKELRPSKGLVRTYEFVMQDGYGKFSNQTKVDLEFQNIYQVYLQIFNTLGVKIETFEFDESDSFSIEFRAVGLDNMFTIVDKVKKYIELGHIFKFKDTTFKNTISFGIGTQRLLQYLIESNFVSFSKKNVGVVMLPKIINDLVIVIPKQHYSIENFLSQNSFKGKNILVDNSYKLFEEKDVLAKCLSPQEIIYLE